VRRTSTRAFAAKLVCFSVAFERLSTMICRNCREPLDIHQPNSNQPDQFLGICSGCDCWFRIEVGAESSQARVIQLPEIGEVFPGAPSPASALEQDC
jgi:hypothetical protein